MLFLMKDRESNFRNGSLNKTPHDIYIVDDDKAYGKSLVRLLKSVGYSAESFLSAQSFLDSVPVAYKTGVLILDLRMPGMDGFDLQKRMNELASRLKIIFITADAQPGDRDHAMNVGAVGFLQKPFGEQILFETIDSAFSGITDESHKENNKEQR
ncbi:MAG: response regulator transcription factor [Planctomycetota bacterium]|jgi:FixJ family two-component response regulator